MNKLVDLELFEVSVVDQGANGLADIVLCKRKEEKDMPRKKTEVTEEVTKVDNPVMEQEEETVDVEDACDSKTTKSVDEPVVEAVSTEKSIDTVDVEKLKDDLVKVKKDLLAASLEVRKLRSEKEEAEWVSKAAEIVFDTPANVGKILHRVAEFDKILADDVYSLLKAASSQSKEGELFSEIGKSGDTKISAYDKLAKIADDIRKSQNLTEAKAFTKACEMNPSLVAEYRLAQ